MEQLSQESQCSAAERNKKSSVVATKFLGTETISSLRQFLALSLSCDPLVCPRISLTCTF